MTVCTTRYTTVQYQMVIVSEMRQNQMVIEPLESLKSRVTMIGLRLYRVYVTDERVDFSLKLVSVSDYRRYANTLL